MISLDLEKFYCLLKMGSLAPGEDNGDLSKDLMLTKQEAKEIYVIEQER